jgi:signal transduction histidine kinase
MIFNAVSVCPAVSCRSRATRRRQAVEAGKCVDGTGTLRWARPLVRRSADDVRIQSDTYYGDIEDFRRRIYPEDQELASKALADARQNREPFIAEFRVLRLDGTVRWINARGQFYYGANGDAVRMLGMAVDITERKRAEESLANIGRSLIEAHEEERTWIARELHDDVNQRMALLAIELDRWSQQPRSSDCCTTCSSSCGSEMPPRFARNECAGKKRIARMRSCCCG